MAKKTYIGVNGVARQVKKMYVGVGGVARKVKKAYIGVAGVARCFFGGGELSYYGTASDLTTARNKLAATTVGDYAIFGGGDIGSTTPSATYAVSAYNSSITKTTMQSGLRTIAYYLAATTVGNYALFGGGGYYSSNTTKEQSIVSVFDNALTRLSTYYYLSQGRYALAATTVGNYALFGGGYAYTSSPSGISSLVDAYDSSLTRTKPTSLSEGRYELATTTVGNHALFGGGSATSTYWGPRSTTVDAYDTSLTRTTPTALSFGRSVLSATANGSYAIFAGGMFGTGDFELFYSSKVDAYDTSLTQTSATDLSVERYGLMGASIGGYALFAGGYRRINNNGSYSDSYEATVDAYDTSLTRTLPSTMSEGKHEGAGTTVGNYALFGGGIKSSASGGSRYYSSKAVDVYTVA